MPAGWLNLTYISFPDARFDRGYAGSGCVLSFTQLAAYRRVGGKPAAALAIQGARLKRLLAQVLIVGLRILARMPLRVARAAGAAIGAMAWWLNTRPARITMSNIDACFSRLSPRRRRDLCRASLLETGRLVGEMGLAWHGKAEVLARCVRTVEGAELIRAPLAGGILVLMPHFGNWEILSYVFRRVRVTCLYAPPRVAGLEHEMNRARGRWGAIMVPPGLRGLRAVKQALADGDVVGLLPDQTPSPAAGVWAPFFGQEALTMTLAHRLMTEKTRVILSTAQRVPGGFEVRHVGIDDRIRDPDPVTSATALNAAIEAAVLRDPAQYQWEYNRFRHALG